MSKLIHYKVTEEDIYDVLEVLDNLRQEDIDEIGELSGHLYRTKWETLNAIYENGTGIKSETYLLCNTHKGFNTGPVALFGIHSPSLFEGTATVWLLATDELKANLSYFKIAKEYLDKWNEEHEILWNVVSNENVKTIEWLKRIGFEVSEVDEVMSRFIYNPPQQTN